MRIIPAIDLIDGTCVRLQGGCFEKQTTYNEDPVHQAQIFYNQGFRRLHIVDLDGARTKRLTSRHIDLVKTITKSLPQDLVIDYSGGIQNVDDVKTVIAAGARKIIIGSLSVTKSDIFQAIMGAVPSEQVILAADSKDGFVYINGWADRTKYTTEKLISEFIELGGIQVMITDIARDGLLTGVNLETYRSIRKQFSNIHLIASGGVARDDDIIELSKLPVDEIIVGKALYTEQLSLTTLQEFIW